MTSQIQKSLPPSSMPESLFKSSPRDALLHLSACSESNALKLAQQLAKSLSTSSTSLTSTPSSIHNNTNQTHYPINLPPTLSKYSTSSSSSTSSTLKPKITRKYHHQQNDPLITSKACTESIQTSLSKVASGGSAASTTLRNLESQRRATDLAAKDVQHALSLRSYSNLATDALGARRYEDAVKSIADFEMVEKYASERAMQIAGVHAMKAKSRTRDVLSRTILERYEKSVESGDLKELSTLTPLLGMLQMANKGVGLYLTYAQSTLSQIIDSNLERDAVEEGKQNMDKMEEQAGVKISRAEHKRRMEKKRGGGEVTVCTKLAKIYNAAVTFLRHHLPMVAFSLGEADGDAALVQLIHAEVERRAMDVIRHYMTVKRVAMLCSRSVGVANAIEEKYLNGDGMAEEEYYQQDIFESVANASSSATTTPASKSNVGKAFLKMDGSKFDKKKVLDRMDDCGFKAELGTFVQVNANLDELALLLQHTESYERFIRHAVDEVNKARALRKEQKREERKKKWIQELENEGEDATMEQAAEFDEEEDEMEKTRRVQDVLPAQTQLNEIVVEAGGYFTGLERTFLTASLQRAFQSVILSDERSYSPITILSQNSNRSSNSVGRKALQTSLVEECLYAAQRSTLRAFATGHSSTASVASNFCVDILGRFLLEVLIHRADGGTAMLKPGDGLLPGQGGLGQAALAVMSSAQKGLARARTTTTKGLMTGGGGGHLNEAEEKILIQQRITEGIAMSCAKLNDLEVAVDYTSRLEKKLLDDMQSTFPTGKKETEQLKTCIKALTGVKDSFFTASNDSIDHLTSTIMPRVRSIVTESVGQDNVTTSGFMGGSTVPGSTVRMNYHLDTEAFQMAQLSEGYMSRLCQSLDELVDPMRLHLASRLSDNLILGIIGGASKRLEGAIKRSQFTPLGAIALDSDIRFFVNFVKEKFDSANLSSSVTLYKACNPLARLAQISLLMNVDDLEDVLDLISSSKRKQMWDISLNDAKAFLNLRVDFEGRKVNDLLQISD